MKTPGRGIDSEPDFRSVPARPRSQTCAASRAPWRMPASFGPRGVPTIREAGMNPGNELDHLPFGSERTLDHDLEIT